MMVRVHKVQVVRTAAEARRASFVDNHCAGAQVIFLTLGNDSEEERVPVGYLDRLFIRKRKKDREHTASRRARPVLYRV